MAVLNDVVMVRHIHFIREQASPLRQRPKIDVPEKKLEAQSV